MKKLGGYIPLRYLSFLYKNSIKLLISSETEHNKKYQLFN
jgi:hypothetical protein